LKRRIVHAYRPIEEAVMKAVAGRFGLDMSVEAQKAVKKADLIMLATEARDLTGAGYVRGPLPEPPHLKHITRCWDAALAEENFLRMYACCAKGGC
jgi:hypothetical protein